MNTNAIKLSILLMLALVRSTLGVELTNLVSWGTNEVILDTLPTSQSQVGSGYLSTYFYYEYEETAQLGTSLQLGTNAFLITKVEFLVKFDRGTNRDALTNILMHDSFSFQVYQETNEFSQGFFYSWFEDYYSLDSENIRITKSNLGADLYLLSFTGPAAFHIMNSRVLAPMLFSDTVRMSLMTKKGTHTLAKSYVAKADFSFHEVSDVAAMRVEGRRLIGKPKIAITRLPNAVSVDWVPGYALLATTSFDGSDLQISYQSIFASIELRFEIDPEFPEFGEPPVQFFRLDIVP